MSASCSVRAVLFDLDGTLVDHEGAAATAVGQWLTTKGWANAETIGGLIDATEVTTDTGRRAQLWRQVEQKVMESATVLPFVHDRSLWYRNPRLTNVGILPALGLYDLGKVGVR